jgi:hypothetical protein
MPRVMTLIALVVLGSSGEPFHEPSHARSLASGHPVAARNLAGGAEAARTRAPRRRRPGQLTGRCPVLSCGATLRSR